MARPKIATGGIYHVYNRGVEKRDIFMDHSDYFRFIHDLFEFNDEAPAANHVRMREVRLPSSDITGEVGLPSFNWERPRRKLLVDILAFCLMPNHYHLLLRQWIDGGISKFMQKLGTGYTNYFNTKFKRDGVLFQGKYKAKLVERESHFIYLPHYIHLNPLDSANIKWREGKIRDIEKALKFLVSYRWSSYLDYIGIRNFPSLTQRKFLQDLFDEQGGCKKSLTRWLEMINLDMIKKIAID